MKPIVKKKITDIDMRAREPPKSLRSGEKENDVGLILE